MSQAMQVGPTWLGFHKISRLFIFAVGTNSIGRVEPNAKLPLGVPFPGTTYNEPGLPNWVGHLITKYSPRSHRYRPGAWIQDRKYKADPLLVYDYAAGGAMVSTVVNQIREQFLPVAGQNMGSGSWNQSNSLFVTWVGINDSAFNIDPAATIEALFNEQEALYTSGARNFLFIDVPPMHRSPSAMKPGRKPSSAPIDNWNSHLRLAMESFFARHEDITLFLFASSVLFDRILDDPVMEGFAEVDVDKSGGGIWKDWIHPTSKVHAAVAKELAEFLGGVKAGH